jgi:cytochrome c-type biogenesis protein CcmE
MKGKTAIIISIGVVLGALGLLLYTGLSANMVYYYHVDEFFAKADSLSGETVKVNGKVVDQSIHKQQMDYQFVIQGKSGKTMNVSYHGVVPDTFKNGSDVVVEGIYNPGTSRFTATTLLAKCPTKYESQQQAYRANQTPATRQN